MLFSFASLKPVQNWLVSTSMAAVDVLRHEFCRKNAKRQVWARYCHVGCSQKYGPLLGIYYSILRHLVFRVPKSDPNFGNYPCMHLFELAAANLQHLSGVLKPENIWFVARGFNSTTTHSKAVKSGHDLLVWHSVLDVLLSTPSCPLHIPI